MDTRTQPEDQGETNQPTEVQTMAGTIHLHRADGRWFKAVVTTNVDSEARFAVWATQQHSSREARNADGYALLHASPSYWDDLADFRRRVREDDFGTPLSTEEARARLLMG